MHDAPVDSAKPVTQTALLIHRGPQNNIERQECGKENLREEAERTEAGGR